MEKLQPFLKQRYWICFGLALIFVLVGWWNASGALATKTDERKKLVEGAFSSAEKGKTDPNEAWVAGGKKENELDAAAYKTASLQLWKRQQAAREWPEQIRSEMQQIAYFADINSKETRERWVSIYRTQIEDLLKIVQPFQHDTGEGLVLVDANRITRQPFNKWQIDYPSSNEIWSNQEDIWLLKALLTSIAKTNDSATRITESQVPEIRQLTLRGGDRKTKPGAKSGGGGMGGLGGGGLGAMRGGDMGGGGMGGSVGGEMTMGGGMGGGGKAAYSHPGTAYEGNSSGDVLVEEFGPVAGGGGMRGMGGVGGFGGPEGAMMGDPTGGSMGGAKVSAAKKEVRYVDDAEKDQGYKTRAFLLDVLIRDERLPDLLAKLTNSDFPVEIVRVEIQSRSAGGGGGMPGGYGGAAGMPGGYGGGMSSNGMGMPGEGDSLGGLGGMPGGIGAMSPGMGGMGGAGSDEGFPGLGGMLGEGGYPAEGGGYGMMGAGTGAAKGVEVLNAALADPLLIEVRIGGLLTLYMTPEESETQAKTEETAAKEAEKSMPAVTEPGASNTQTGTEPGEIVVPETSDALNPGSEIPAAGSTQDTTVPEVSVPDASSNGPPVDGSVPGQSLSPQGNDPKPAGDEPDAPDGNSVSGGTGPPVTPSP